MAQAFESVKEYEEYLKKQEVKIVEPKKTTTKKPDTKEK